jgi:hypothetical protein
VAAAAGEVGAGGGVAVAEEAVEFASEAG